MSKKKPVMSHDPLEGMGSDADPGGGAQDPACPSGVKDLPPEKFDAADEPIRLPSTLTIADVGELHAVFVERVLAVSPFTVDGSEVDSIDNAGLQLLAVVWKSAESKELRSNCFRHHRHFARPPGRSGLRNG